MAFFFLLKQELKTRRLFEALQQISLELFGKKFTLQKLNYVHMNPVAAGFVKSPEQWQYSSCTDYYGVGKGELELVYLE
jgi:hypothetical protein